ncbi:MAG: hypothetical protein HY364_03790 [Candidatus Aenigmarchaeota archaeon]|nr:hypothetical protein [Candidatus Aenigmarchaeota archaeon]
MPEKPKDFILDDKMFTTRNPITGVPNARVNDKGFDSEYFGPHGKYLGHAVCSMPFEMFTKINPTTPPGMTSGIWMSLLLQLRKWEYNGVKKISETIEVTPTYSQYYHITIAQKEEIEGRIKAGLQSISQSIADLELLKHDERKYREFLDYFGVKYDPDAPEDKRWSSFAEKKDEHALRAVFIDQVDAHTGDSIAMRNIVSRWPTLITDFMRMGSETDVNIITEKLNVSKAEAVVLSSKNRLYQEWKKLFEPELKSRYQKITELVRSREYTVHMYREWLGPNILRHKLLAEGLEGKGMGSHHMHENFLFNPSQALAVNNIRAWAWRFYTATEFARMAGSEEQAVEQADGTFTPYDKWTQDNLIFHKDHGLVVKYKWITKDWVDEKVKHILTETSSITTRKLYYSFFVLDINKMNMRLASGDEIEDADFFIYGVFMSQNVLLVKLLEYEAMKQELDWYVDELLGLKKSLHDRIHDIEHNKKTEKETKEKKNQKSSGDSHDSGHDEHDHDDKKEDHEGGGFHEGMAKISETLAKIGFAFQFMKNRPYEKDFDERIGKIHLRGMAKERYAPIVNFLKNKIGIGKGGATPAPPPKPAAPAPGGGGHH